ncbi:Carbohydrate-binding family 9 [Halogranum rubrum]|uniref:Carbohydrate-binding family 9 n=1 Tax=Halogranum rubrum TaxID=553466 RepID=A0A1I4HR13_9EURY|nr:carbohydrate-binding family 9-like protein [Halogranum rubrum]SFL44180.1 Carbohydrate-binding family 9 [Halogranum rubrum]
MTAYEVRRVDAETTVPLTGDVDETVWQHARVARLDQYPWGDEPGPSTTARVLYDTEALYLQFHADDTEITADVTELNGPTFADSSVEFFATPAPATNEDPGNYFNFEANCCGTFKLAWQEPNWREREIGRSLVSPAAAASVTVETSVPGPTKSASPDDVSWWLAARIPWSTLRSLTDLSLRPDSETVWRGNFYRSGVPDEAKGTWNRIGLPTPVYHSPRFFGRIDFE